jgi:hypothetical protein
LLEKDWNSTTAIGRYRSKHLALVWVSADPPSSLKIERNYGKLPEYHLHSLYISTILKIESFVKSK